MITQKTYLVMGSAVSGDFSSPKSWVVTSYADKDAAEQHVALANAWAVEKGVDFSAIRGSGDPRYRGPMEWKIRRELYGKNPFDRSKHDDSQILYYGVKYFVQEVQLVRHVDEYQETQDD